MLGDILALLHLWLTSGVPLWCAAFAALAGVMAAEYWISCSSPYLCTCAHVVTSPTPQDIIYPAWLTKLLATVRARGYSRT